VSNLPIKSLMWLTLFSLYHIGIETID
jgi:hypothetical protein